jgi:6-phosphogluconolactonase
MRVFADPAEVARAAAEFVVDVSAEAVDATERFLIALSGGGTPRGLYERLAGPAYAERIPWESVHVFWGDERCVPPFDPQSDYGMAKATLLDHVPIAEGHIHRIRGEDEPELVAGEYERLLRRTFGAMTGPPPSVPGARIDLTLLGLGEDAHTASLFPGTDAVQERQRWVVPVEAPASPRRRVSLTPPILNASAHTLFMVTGVEKAGAVAAVLEGPSDPLTYPAQAIEGAEWFVDADAASLLTT